MKLFDPDSRFMQDLAFIGRLIILDLCFLLCSLPLFTIGASLTAMYSVTLDEKSEDKGSVSARFFSAFRQNFGKATALWGIMLLIAAILYIDYRIFSSKTFTGSYVSFVIYLAVLLCYLPTLLFLFPIQSHFENSIGNTLKNAFVLSILFLPQSVLMILISLFPLILLWRDITAFFRIIPIWFLIGFSATAQINSFFLRRIFKKQTSQPR